MNKEGNTYSALGYVKSKYANISSPSSSTLSVVLTPPLQINLEAKVLPSVFPDFSTNSSPAPPVPKLASKGREILVDVEQGLKMTKNASSEDAGRRASKLQSMAAKVAALQAKKRSTRINEIEDN